MLKIKHAVAKLLNKTNKSCGVNVMGEIMIVERGRSVGCFNENDTKVNSPVIKTRRRLHWCSQSSETEGEVLGTAGSKSVDEATQTKLVSDAGSSEALGDDANHDAEHRHTAIEKLNAFQLCHMNFASRRVLEPLVVGRRGRHDRFACELMLQVLLRNVKGWVVDSSRAPLVSC